MGSYSVPDETARFVEDLLALLTLEEKLGQLDLLHPADDPALEQAILAGRIGGIVGAGAARRWQELATERARRGIPLLLVRPRSPAPLSPHALAAGWDEELARELGAHAALQARAEGFNAMMGPDVSLAPAAGDVAGPSDCATAEPQLAARLAAGWIAGATEDGGVLAIAACPPDAADALAFALALVDSDTPLALDCAALAPRIAQRAGFGGILIAECAAISAFVAQRFAATRARTALEAAETALADGSLDEARIDAAVRGVLATKHALGLFRDPHGRATGELAALGTAAASHTAAAGSWARRTMVLLRNEAGLLPLSPVSDRVLVVGPAEGPARACADALGRAGIGRLNAPGLSPRRGAESWLDPAPGDAFALALTRDAAKRADFALVVLEDHHFASYPGSPWQRPGAAAMALVQALAPIGTRLVAILATETPVDLGETDAHFAAVLQGWRPGPGFGEALGDILSGRAGPQGRMPSAAGRYALGHGLSYGTSVFSGFTARPLDDRIAARLSVRNDGSFHARETVQLYARGGGGELRLVTYRHVQLAPGEQREVEFALGSDELAVCDSEGRRELQPGSFELFAGKDQRRVLSASVVVTPAFARLMARRSRERVRLAG